jgi:murein DD-endopeptidase MepM/ murein hydrolase activator NlpD
VRAALPLGASLAALLAAPALSAQQYRLPLELPETGTQPYITAYRDHDSSSGLRDWSCGSKTYDGHKGTDIGIGSFPVMDSGSRKVVAAADGVVSAIIDGCFDRCTSGTCECGGGFGNYVKLVHADGKSTYYAHLMKGSLAVSKGEQVKCGQVLGKVGSSGYSTGPHLHFEPRYSDNTSDDPYAGSCSGPISFWTAQGSYLELPSDVCEGPPAPPPPPDCNDPKVADELCLMERLIVPYAGLADGSPSSDFDGDGRADMCARASDGIFCRRASGNGFSGSIAGPELSNALGWAGLAYYATIRMGDVSGDGKADLCARSGAGFSCWLSNGAGFPKKINGPEWSDANGWAEPRFWSTIRLADVNGDGMADACARSSAGITCHLATGSGFGAALAGPELSDAKGFDAEKHYATLRFADVSGDGKADVCVRTASGFSCWLSDGAGFPEQIAGPELADASGWDAERYWGTIRMGDVDGDGKADLCARHSEGVSCWLSDGAGFPTEIAGPALSDADGWGKVGHWSTLRLVDLNGDGKADLCGRAATGFVCWLSTGSGFGDPIAGPDMADAGGWNAPRYFATFRVADITGDGNAEVCGRGYSGIVCWPFDGAGFGDEISGPAWSDENGWGAAQYYTTIQAAGARGGVSGSGGQTAGSGGTGGIAATGGSGSAQAGAGGLHTVELPSEDLDAGCACRAAGSRSRTSGALFALLVAVALGLRRPRSARAHCG